MSKLKERQAQKEQLEVCRDMGGRRQKGDNRLTGRWVHPDEAEDRCNAWTALTARDAKMEPTFQYLNVTGKQFCFPLHLLTSLTCEWV